MPTLPKKAILDAERKKLFIDGEEFPWYIAEDGMTIATMHGLPTVTVTVLVEDVEYILPVGDVTIY